MNWFDEVFFPSLVERYEKNGKFYLSEKQEKVFRRYAKPSSNPDFYVEYKGYGIYYTGYGAKSRMAWKNGKAWFEKKLTW